MAYVTAVLALVATVATAQGRHVRRRRMTSVGVLPDSADKYLGCVTGSDLNSVSIGSEIAEIVLGETASSETQDAVSSVLNPISRAVSVAIAASGALPWAQDSICFGNFNSEELKKEISIDHDPMHYNRCFDIPVKKGSEWTAFAFALSVPMPGLCSLMTPGQMAFCGLVSKHPTNGQYSVAFNVKAETITCLGENMGIAATGGVGKLAMAAVDMGLDSIGAGFSMDRSFEKSVKIYTGQRDDPNKPGSIVEYPVFGNYYDQVKVKIKFEKLAIPEIIAFGGKYVRTIGISGIDDVDINNMISGFKPTNEDSDILDTLEDIGEELSKLTVEAAASASLTFALKFSNLQKSGSATKQALGRLLPDSKAITIAEANMFFRMSKENGVVPSGYDDEGTEVPPGLYFYAGQASIPNIAVNILGYFLDFAGSILEVVGWDFGGKAIDAFKETMIDSINTNNLDEGQGFGMSFTSEFVGLYLYLPIAWDLIEFIRFDCKYDYGSDLSCKVDSALQHIDWEVIGDFLEEKVLWKLYEGGKFIAATASDAVDEVADWGEQALQDTGRWITDEVTDPISDEIKSWALEAKAKCGWETVTNAAICGSEIIESMSVCGFDTVVDGTLCGFDYVTDGAKCGFDAVTDATKCGVDTVTSGAKCGYDFVTSGAQCGFDTVTSGAKCGYNTVTSAVECGVNTVTDAAKCGTYTISKCWWKPWECGKYAKTCDIDATCDIPKTCNIAKSCNMPKTCDTPKTCNIAKSCNIDAQCDVPKSCEVALTCENPIAC